jgi:hypothetical protein
MSQNSTHQADRRLISANKIDTTKKSNKKSWILQPRCLCTNPYSLTSKVEIPLDGTFETVESVPGLKTSLFPHQKTVVKAMIDLEKNLCFKATGKKQYMQNFEMYEIKTSAGVLSEAVGSGKTIDILAVIILQKIPRVCPDIAHLDLVDYNNYVSSRYYVSSIRKKFRNILKPTIVFTGVSVIDQWISAIKTFTNLKYFSVCDVRDLQKLINMMSDKSINQYDIIIVKNGKVTRPIILPDHLIVENKNADKTVLYIYNIIVNMRNFCWARCVIDDFDTIKLPHNAGIINSLFTWYISSTRKLMPVKNQNNSQFYTTADMLMYSNYSCGNIMKNPVLFYNLNVRNDPDFVKQTNMISSPKFYAYVFANLNNQYMGFLGLIGDSEANEVMEMLNGDAIETAAERIGIKTDSVADIFQSILGKQFDKYKKSIDVLEYIREIEPMQGQREPMTSNPDSEDTYKKSDLFIRREISYNYPNLKSIIESTKEEYTEIKKTSSIAIERVKNNIKEGECPICTSDLSDNDEEILIVKCCGVILCGVCCFGTVFPKGKVSGQCSNCRAQLQLTSLIYLNSDFDLSKIVDENLNEPEKKEELTKGKKENDEPRTKLCAILDIIKGTKPPEQKRVDVNIHNLMKGTNILPEPKYNKVLIFASYDESITKIKKKLDEDKISYWQLGGTHREITEIVRIFTECKKTCVLIVNSMKHCSGLNLQTATDLIFAHKIIDPNVETQVIGRGQRLGRLNQLSVHFMFYKNEYDWMTRNNTIRVIEDVEQSNIGQEMISGLEHIEAPVIEAPVIEAPVIEAPVIEAPVIEAPVIEAPDSDSDSDSASASASASDSASDSD